MSHPYTARLRLEPLMSSDADELFAVRGDPEAMAFWDGPPDTSPSQTAEVIKTLSEEVRGGTALHWAARLRSDGSMVGACDLSEIRNGESADIGFLLLRVRATC